MKDKLKFKLDSEELRNIVYENYCIDTNGNEWEFETIENIHEGEGRHETFWSRVVKRNDGIFFKIKWASSIKDNMDWEVCNPLKEYTVEEVIATDVTITKYL